MSRLFYILSMCLMLAIGGTSEAQSSDSLSVNAEQTANDFLTKLSEENKKRGSPPPLTVITDTPKEALEIQGFSYVQYKLIELLFISAITNDAWGESLESLSPGPLKNVETRKLDYYVRKDPSRSSLIKSLEKYIYPEGHPRTAAISKWKKDRLTVSFNIPFALDTATPSSFSKTLESSLPLINVVTAKEMEIGPAEKADIFIIPVPNPRTSNDFKLYSGNHGIVDQAWWFKDLLRYGIEFTPNSKTGVGGFLLLNNDNSIGKSFCFINSGDAREADLIDECLLRSMGLTNSVPDAGSKLLRGVIPSYQEKASNQDAIADSKKLAAFSRYIEPSKKFTLLDVVLLNLLYCKEVSIGDDKNALAKKLSEKGSCLQEYYRE